MIYLFCHCRLVFLFLLILECLKKTVKGVLDPTIFKCNKYISILELISGEISKISLLIWAFVATCGCFTSFVLPVKPAFLLCKNQQNPCRRAFRTSAFRFILPLRSRTPPAVLQSLTQTFFDYAVNTFEKNICKKTNYL